MTWPTDPQDSQGSWGESNPYGRPAGSGQEPSYGPPSSYGQEPGYPGSGQIPPYGQPGYSGYGQGGYQTPTGYPGGPGGTARNSLGVWSLVLGILGLCCGFLGIGAIITGYLARQAVGKGEANNGGIAMAGLILGWIAVGLWVLSLILRATGVLTYHFGSFSS